VEADQSVEVDRNVVTPHGVRCVGIPRGVRVETQTEVGDRSVEADQSVEVDRSVVTPRGVRCVGIPHEVRVETRAGVILRVPAVPNAVVPSVGIPHGVPTAGIRRGVRSAGIRGARGLCGVIPKI
jgi:hypothetical protein